MEANHKLIQYYLISRSEIEDLEHITGLFEYNRQQDYQLAILQAVRERPATNTKKMLNQKLIRIFQDVIDNRCFELGYDEIQGILSELRQQGER